jgi:hypothetical protein
MQPPRFNLFLRVATLCALVMATGIAACGQTGFLYAASLRASSAPSNALARPDFPRASLVPGDVLPPALSLRTPFPDSKLRRVWTEQAALSEAHVSPVSPDLVSRIAAHCQELKTPFLVQVQIPLFRALGGRLQLGGFGNNTAMQNVVWGPSDSAFTSVRSGHSPDHFGARPPSDNESYGLSLRLSGATPGLSGGGIRKGLRVAARAMAGRVLARY